MSEYADMHHIYTAKVRKPATAERSAALLALLQAGGVDLDERTPFFWSAEISNTGLDAYFTHMTAGTLANFASDARAGVSFLNSHRRDELPLGRSLDGRVEGDGEKLRALADFYTMPGLRLNELSTDDFIAGVRTGLVHDVSVGFYGGKHTCDLCGNNYYSYRCPHIAGLKYEVEDNGEVRMVLATVTIDNARLSEVSAVYDGATPGAAIIKAQRMAEAGELRAQDAQVLEARYRVRLPLKRSFAGIEPGKGETMDFEKMIADIRTALNLDEAADVTGAVAGLAAEVEQLRKAGDKVVELEQRIKALEPQAEDGRQYRSDLIAEALAEGVRALGDKFDRAARERTLQALPLADIKAMRDAWSDIGDARFPRGRQSVDESEAPGNGRQQPSLVPDHLYAV